MNISDDEYYQNKAALIDENKNKELSYLDNINMLTWKGYSARWDAAKSDQEKSSLTSKYKMQLEENELKRKQITDKAIIDSDNLRTEEILKHRRMELDAQHATYELQDMAVTHSLDMFKIAAGQEEETAKYLYGKMEISETQFYDGRIGPNKEEPGRRS